MTYSPPLPPTAPPPAPRPTSGLAVAGLVLAFLLAPVGFVLSLIALGRTGRSRAAGRGLAVAGTIIGGLGTVALVMIAVGIALSTDDGIDREVTGVPGAPVPQAAPSGDASAAAPAPGEGVPAPAPEPAAEAPPSEAFADLTADEWAALVRDPSSRVGELVRFYVEVTQFDTNTGDDTLRGNGGVVQPSAEFELTDNLLLAADPALLASVVAGDVLRVEAQVKDPVDYETMLGGSTSAPVFAAARVESVGFLDLKPDVVLGGYTPQEFGGGNLAVTVTNSGPVPYTYSVEIAAVSPDGATQYDTTSVFADNLAPGQATTQDASFFEDLPTDAVFTVVGVERYDY